MQIQILRQILAGILSTWLAVAPVAPVKLGASNPIPQALGRFETTLASRMSSTETSTATLVIGTTAGGNMLNGIYGFCIDCENSKWEYIIATASGTALTNITRGVSPDDGITSVAGLQKEHLRGASVKITDAPALPYMRNMLNGSTSLPSPLYYQTAISAPSSTSLIDRAWLDTTSSDFARLTGNQTIAGVKTFSSSPIVPNPTTATQAASKSYVDGVAIAGGASSSDTVYGISKLSVAPANANIPIAVGTNDTRLDHYISYAGTVASTTATTSLSGEDLFLTYNDTTGVGTMYLCVTRPSPTYATSLVAYTSGSGDMFAAGGNVPLSMSGLYVNPTSTTEIVKIEVYGSANCTGTFVGVSANERITYIKIN